MVTINSIEDLARILREQPAWADTLRALLLTEDLLDLPARFDRFVQSQEETNRRQEETNRHLSEMLSELKEVNEDSRQRLSRLEGQVTSLEGQVTSLEGQVTSLEGRFTGLEGRFTSLEGRFTSLEGRFTRMEGRFGNFEGAQYEGMVRTKALARAHIQLGFEAPYVALHQEGLADPSLVSAITHAVRESLVTIEDSGDLFEADLIISDEDNRHAVFEVSLTADDHDILRAKRRAETLGTITGGAVIPVVITARIDDARYGQADSEGVMVFVIPYP